MYRTQLTPDMWVDDASGITYREPTAADYDGKSAVEVSPDGIHWIDGLQLLVCRPGLYITRTGTMLQEWTDARVRVAG